jgi:hypothetical protein
MDELELLAARAEIAKLSNIELAAKLREPDYDREKFHLFITETLARLLVPGTSPL